MFGWGRRGPAVIELWLGPGDGYSEPVIKLRDHVHVRDDDRLGTYRYARRRRDGRHLYAWAGWDDQPCRCLASK